MVVWLNTATAVLSMVGASAVAGADVGGMPDCGAAFCVADRSAAGGCCHPASPADDKFCDAPCDWDPEVGGEADDAVVPAAPMPNGRLPRPADWGCAAVAVAGAAAGSVTAAGAVAGVALLFHEASGRSR